MNIHMAKKGQKGRTKVVFKGTFISKQSLGSQKSQKLVNIGDLLWVRHGPKSKNLGGHVVIRRAAAAGSAF